MKWTANTLLCNYLNVCWPKNFEIDLNHPYFNIK